MVYVIQSLYKEEFRGTGCLQVGEVVEYIVTPTPWNKKGATDNLSQLPAGSQFQMFPWTRLLKRGTLEENIVPWLP